MQPFPKEDYLASEVLTATPQRLQLLLIDGALRQIHKVHAHWQKGDSERAGEALLRCQQIITEMLCGLNPEHDRELARKAAGVYLFVFRALTLAHLQHDQQKLSEAASILEIERETWQQVCKQLGSTRAPDTTQSGGEMSFVA
jgi:flagellar secretion chaperone FliS